METSRHTFELSAQRRALLEAMLRKEGMAASPGPRIARRPDPGSAPLSFAQQRLWFLDQLAPGRPLYNAPGAVRLRGPLDVAALEQSLNEVARRHEVLRATFSAVNGEPVQVIAPALTLTLPVRDLRALPEAEREAEALRLATEEAQTPFDLARGPLVRAALLRLGDEEHILLLTLHHIVSDAWSRSVLFRELGAFYNAFAPPAAAERLEGSRLKVESSDPSKPSTFNLQPGTFNPALPELPIQYADYAAWQRECLRGEALEGELAYWRQRLAGAPEVVTLPADRPRPAAKTYRGAWQERVLPATLSEEIKALSRREGVTLFITLLAAFQTLVHHSTGQTDVVVGTNVGSRGRVETEALIGFFINQVALRTDLSGDPTFRSLLSRAREVALEAFAHQDLPFEKVVEVLRPRREASHTPLFQLLFVVTPSVTPEIPGLAASTLKVVFGTSKFDLVLDLIDTAQGLTAWCEYSTDLFNDDTICRILQQYETLLGEIVAAPDATLGELEARLAAVDRQQRLAKAREFEAASFQRLQSVRRQAVRGA